MSIFYSPINYSLVVAVRLAAAGFSFHCFDSFFNNYRKYYQKDCLLSDKYVC